MTDNGTYPESAPVRPTAPTNDRERAAAKARASGMARSELISRHRPEYDRLYAFYSEWLGVSNNLHTERGLRPKAPGYDE